ncbi:uncharacterized protein LOC115996028 [Ipomoea triloba]|uniref:uncharacterized protein LOC115996028 n=1 Tax=Ipomoea triloba TaxID=35885 RepID=UPI00125DCBD4|nr:uncharacterized protein LOC115996028 [Ipomoea triloba]
MGFRKLREMNLALLGKQAWCLITRPNSLVTQVYKSRFYPDGTFFDAVPSSNPSFIWCGLLEVQEVMRRGCRRCIGDGLTTQIGRDPWLPIDDDPYISTPLHKSIFYAPICFLLNNQGFGYDENCVEDIFNEWDAHIILIIPVSLRRPNDAWVWYKESKGAYTVKSCYRMLIGEVHDERPWRLIWNMRVP